VQELGEIVHESPGGRDEPITLPTGEGRDDRIAVLSDNSPTLWCSTGSHRSSDCTVPQDLVPV